MEIIARSNFIRISPRKLRRVTQELVGLPSSKAQELLKNLGLKAAKPIELTLKQGIANAVNNYNLSKENLNIKKMIVGEGPRYKRMDKSHRAFRWGTRQKKTAHLEIVLEGKEKEQKVVSDQPANNEKKIKKVFKAKK